jgi:hypothetical protein
LQLPRFWANSPAAWFRTAEAQFALRIVTDPLEKYYLVLDALSEANIDLVRHIVEDEPDSTSFERIREGLVATHILTDYQRIDRLVAMEPLSGRKPSELLADMNKLKPADDKQFFAYFFLNRLPREVSILLSQEPVFDMRALAAKAEALMALHVLHQHGWRPLRRKTPMTGQPRRRPGAAARSLLRRRRKSIAASAASRPTRRGGRPCAGCISVLGTRHAAASRPTRGQRRRRKTK